MNAKCYSKMIGLLVVILCKNFMTNISKKGYFISHENNGQF